jgi:hypothetical protein
MENNKNKFLNKKRKRSNFSNDSKTKKYNGKSNSSKNFDKNNTNKNEEQTTKTDNFNKGEFKKKYDKRYILSKLNNSKNFKNKFSKKKTDFSKNQTDLSNHNNLNLTITENLYKKAKSIYEEKVKYFFISVSNLRS